MRTVTKLLLLSVVVVFISCQKEVDYATDNNSGSTGEPAPTIQVI
jgi:hypothetical protein